MTAVRHIVGGPCNSGGMLDHGPQANSTAENTEPYLGLTVLSTTHLHRTVHLGGSFPKIAATRSQIYHNQAQMSKAAIPTQRIMATMSSYHPDPGALGLPTISDGNLSPSR